MYSKNHWQPRLLSSLFLVPLLSSAFAPAIPYYYVLVANWYGPTLNTNGIYSLNGGLFEMHTLRQVLLGYPDLNGMISWPGVTCGADTVDQYIAKCQNGEQGARWGWKERISWLLVCVVFLFVVCCGFFLSLCSSSFGFCSPFLWDFCFSLLLFVGKQRIPDTFYTGSDDISKASIYVAYKGQSAVDLASGLGLTCPPNSTGIALANCTVWATPEIITG